MRSQNSGLSLLEVLIVLVIMSMIGVGLASMFGTANQVWVRVESVTPLTQRHLNRLVLRRVLHEMPVVSPSLPLNQIFNASEGSIEFQRTEATTEFSDVILYDRQDQRLVHISGYGTETAVSSMLFSNVERVEIQYYGRKAPRTEAQWHRDWRDAQILPRLIKIEVMGPSGLVHPPLIIEPARTTRHSLISASSLVPPG